MREILRGKLGRSLRGISQEDRLAAAWTVACGRTLSGRGSVCGYQDGVVQVEVEDAVWLRQLSSLRGVLTAQMAQSAGVPVERIEFVMKRRDVR